MRSRCSPITVFTPSFADEEDSNAQNLTVKEVVSRLCPDRFRVLMLRDATPDPRIAGRQNVELIPWSRRGNSVRCLGKCLREKPHIYFFPREGPLDAGFLKLRRWLGLRTKLVTYVVSGGLQNSAPRATLDRNVRQADAVYGNCLHLTRIIKQRWRINAGTIYDGIDRRFYFAAPKHSSSEPGRLVVLFAGSLRPYKRPELIVRNAARWPEVQFRIAGIGEQESNCRRLASDLNCQNVSFLGHLSSQELGNEMRNADVFLFPSVIEGHPQVLGQAAACGLPAVAMDVYRPEFVIHERTGFLVSSDNELAQKLDLLLKNAGLRNAFSVAASEHARRFDWDSVTRCWERAFETVVEGAAEYSKAHVAMQAPLQ